MVKLSEITSKIGSGATPSGGSSVYSDNGISFIRSQNVLDMAFSNNGLVFVNEEQAYELRNVAIESGDILLNITGDSVARSCVVPENILPARVNQHVSIIRCKDKNDSEYLGFYLQYLKPYLLKICRVGGTRNALTKESIGKLPILYPIDRQEKVRILTLINRKIAINHQINAQLEQMAKTLYDYWFVQFDFPDENGKPYKSSGGEMVYNETLKREIPKGWEVKSLEEVEPNIITGKTPSTQNEEFFNGNIPFITISDIRNNMFIFQTEQKLSKTGAESQSSKYLPKDSLCVSCIATVGLIGFTTQKSQTNQQINSIIFKNKYNGPYFYFYLKDYFVVGKAKTGNTFANMNKGDFANIKMIYPSSNIIEKFFQNIVYSFQKIKKLQKQNQQLTQLRDFLLPILMNGQVGVGDD